MRGVCSYGTPASSTLLKGVCGIEYKDIVIELNRLMIIGNEPNLASQFVLMTMKMLPRPTIIVSYADTEVGHSGIIYQALNFIYTGLSSKFMDPKVKGLEHQHHASYAHGMTNDQLREKFGDRLYFKERSRKHRYIMFLGSKVQKKKMLKALKYKIEKYPKGPTVNTGNQGFVFMESNMTMF